MVYFCRMNSVTLYKQIKDALIKQRADIIASPEYASKLIDDLGIRDLFVPKVKKTATKAVAKKTVSPKAAK